MSVTIKPRVRYALSNRVGNSFDANPVTGFKTLVNNEVIYFSLVDDSGNYAECNGRLTGTPPSQTFVAENITETDNPDGSSLPAFDSSVDAYSSVPTALLNQVLNGVGPTPQPITGTVLGAQVVDTGSTVGDGSSVVGNVVGATISDVGQIVEGTIVTPSTLINDMIIINRADTGITTSNGTLLTEWTNSGSGVDTQVPAGFVPDYNGAGLGVSFSNEALLLDSAALSDTRGFSLCFDYVCASSATGNMASATTVGGFLADNILNDNGGDLRFNLFGITYTVDTSVLLLNETRSKLTLSVDYQTGAWEVYVDETLSDSGTIAGYDSADIAAYESFNIGAAFNPFGNSYLGPDVTIFGVAVASRPITSAEIVELESYTEAV